MGPPLLHAGVSSRVGVVVSTRYVFDYTAQSIERRQGFVVMLGGRVESVGFANATDAKPRVAPVAAPVVNVTMTYGPTTPTQPPAKVLDMDEWRRTHPERSRLQ